MDDTQYLVSLGEEYIEEHIENLLCAFAGGSVGRGDADVYSDLDLNFYFSKGTVQPYSQNVKFKDKIIQLHIDNLPSIEQVYSEPWDFRFLAEARAIYDPQCLLQQLLSKTKEYLVTQKARQLMFLQAKKIVSSRIQWLNRTIESNECITAGIAVNAAWTDAAFLYAYFIHYSLCTGQLLPIIRNLSFYPDFRDIRFSKQKFETKLLLHAASDYRAFLRETNPVGFELDPIQDLVVEGKVSRYVENGDDENIHWQLSGEAFGCFLSCNNGDTCEQHYNKLPDEIKYCLHKLGYIPYDQEQINVLLNQAYQMIELVEKGVSKNATCSDL